MSKRKPLLPEVLVSGTSIRLLALETTKSKWTTVLIGARPGRYLLVEMPRVAGAPVKLDEGTHWAANFISKGAVYSFNTEVLGYTYRLVPLLFLGYPQEVDVSNLRTEKRYPVNIPVVFQIADSPPPPAGASAETAESVAPDEPGEPAVPAEPSGPQKALVVDISEGGFLMAGPLPLLPEAQLEATFYLPKGEPIAGVKALVRACRGKPGGYYIGLAYSQSNPPEVVGRLDNLISSIENTPLRL